MLSRLNRLFKIPQTHNTTSLIRKSILSVTPQLKSKKESDDLFRSQLNGITNYFQKERKAGKKVIALFAVGGGNDTFSALHLGQYFKEKLGFKIIFFGAAGFTPYHSDHHSATTKIIEEKPIIKASEYLRRFLQTNPIKEINNNEKQLPKLLNKVGLAESTYYLYSPKYNPIQLAHHVQNTINDRLKHLDLNTNELLIVVSDYGGDILGHDLSTYSPDLDAND